MDPITTFGQCMNLGVNADGELIVPFSPGEPGFFPVIQGTIQSSLGPFGKFLELPPLLANPIKFLDELNKLSPPNLPSLIAEPFNVPGLPKFSLSIELGGVAINLDIGDTDVPGFDPQALIDFITGILKVPLDIFIGIFEVFLTLNLSFDLPGIIETALKPIGEMPLFKDAVDADGKPLGVKLVGCLLDALLFIFAPLGAAAASAKEERDKVNKEKAKEASTKAGKKQWNAALKLINENVIREKDYKRFTGKDAFFTWIEDPTIEGPLKERAVRKSSANATRLQIAAAVARQKESS